MNTLQIFNNEEFGAIRTLNLDGEPWFVGKDIAIALGYVNTKDAVIKHVDTEDRKIIQRSQNTTFRIPPRGLCFINESGLYSLILGSKLPNAKKFKRWVTAEVLPAIRKTGSYKMEEPDKGYPQKATSVSEIVNLSKEVRMTMRAQQCSAKNIAIVQRELYEQFGIRLPDQFVNEDPFAEFDNMNW